MMIKVGMRLPGGEIIVLPSGGVVIDTPGMREIGLERADLSKTFDDINELSIKCKFYDCTHSSEPSCAVQKAIKDGLLNEDRLSCYLKLKKEAKYDGLNSKQIETEKLTAMFKEVGGMKMHESLSKRKIKEDNSNSFPEMIDVTWRYKRTAIGN